MKLCLKTVCFLIMYILGISGGFRWGIGDAAAALIKDNKILCVTEPKLISQEKPLANVDGVLNALNLKTDQKYQN